MLSCSAAEAEKQRLAVLEQEKLRWRVDEAASAEEVRQMKKKLIEQAQGPSLATS